MKKPNITPGPWKAQKPRGPQHAIDRKFEIVAPQARGELVIVGEHTGIDCLKEANARAIAALPTLLETLEAIAHDFRCSDNAEWVREALKEAGYTF
jgi:hypothetical protein